MKCLISTQAEDDLENIWFYTFHNWSVEQADKYLDNLFRQIEFIRNNPFSGKDYGHIRKGYFGLTVQSHIIFYKTDKEKEVVRIIRVLHRRMDIKNRLKN